MTDQEKVDRMRVRGFFLACARKAQVERRTMEVALDEMARCRRRAEKHQGQMVWALEQAELAAEVVASGDATWLAEVAKAIEECFG